MSDIEAIAKLKGCSQREAREFCERVQSMQIAASDFGSIADALERLGRDAEVLRLAQLAYELWRKQNPHRTLPLSRDKLLSLYQAGQRDFSRTDLRQIDLHDLNLKGVILRSAILLGADLRGTDLSNADLGEANLGGDIWDGTARTEELRANLWDANLSGANLKDAKIAEEQLEGVKSLQGAILPDGTISSSSVAKDAEESGLLSDDAVNPPVTAEESRSAASDSDVGVQEAVEGRVYTTEVTFRRRNRALIETKKAQSDGHCEACGFCFEDHYGGLAKDCLVAHHINPIAHRTRPSMTSLDDIALLCPNCHAVVHTQDPPLSLEEVREMLKLDQIP